MRLRRNQQVDGRIFEEVHAIGEEGHRIDAQSDGEFHAEIAQVQHSDDENALSPNLGSPGIRVTGHTKTAGANSKLDKTWGQGHDQRIVSALKERL